MSGKARIEKYQFARPANPLLKQHISYYYFCGSDSDSFKSQYFFYPHYKTAISVYKDSVRKWNKHSSVNYPANKDVINTYFARIYNKRFKSKAIGKYEKIGIAFEALGINHFIEGYLSDISGHLLSHFDHYGPSFLELCSEVFHTCHLETKVELLDNFFLSKYHSFKEDRIKRAVEYIFDLDNDYTTENIANLLQIDRKTLYHLFKKHLCCSVKEFKRVVKFRSALNQYLNSPQRVRLTQLAYDNHFYDQSHFIRNIANLTGTNPKLFFNSLTRIGNYDTYWNYTK